MPEHVHKKIQSIDKPEDQARGQYNFYNGGYPSIKGNTELYTLFSGDEINETNIDNYSFWDTATFNITKCSVINNRDEIDTCDNSFKVYFVDDIIATGMESVIDSDGEYQPSAYSNLSQYFSATADNDLVFSADDGTNCSGWPDDHCNASFEPGDFLCEGAECYWTTSISGQCQLYDWDWESFYFGSWNIQGYDNFTINNFPIVGGSNSYGKEWNTIIYPNLVAHGGEFYYIVIWTQATDTEGWDSPLDNNYTIYQIPKQDLIDLWSDFDEENMELTINFTGSEHIELTDGVITHPVPDPTFSSGAEDSKFKGGDISITISLNGTKNLSDRDFWASRSDMTYYKLRPDNSIDYQFAKLNSGELLYKSDVFDFRPISFISIGTRWENDLQAFYDLDDGYLYTTAPAVVNLTFRLAQNNDGDFYFNYIDGYNEETGDLNDITIWDPDNCTNCDDGVRFMAFVIDWEAEDMEMDWELIVNNLPNNLNDMLYQNSSKDTYYFQDIFFSDDGGGTWNYGSMPHQYNNSGVKIIKAIVFSYVPDETDNYINPLMWKACSIKLYLGVDNAYVEDFGDLGGVGYSFIPWPNTSGMISGISRESAYVNSIESMIQQNLFNDDEIWNKNLLDLAFENTPDRKKGELGNYIGKVDIGQLRYFQRPYDMTDLLMLDGSYDGFVRYDTWGEWYDPYNEVGGSADNPIWSEESCVALLFIKDDTNIDRLESCIIELNMNNINGITIRDTSGNDNRGLVLGDYALSKPDFGVDISREEPSEYPEINIEKKAF